MKVALYARVSTSDKDQNPENQLAPMRAAAAARGWKIAAEYVDHASGAKETRPALDRMMDAARRHPRPFDCVIVWKFDRFGRTVRHLVNALEEFRARSIEFISVTESIDTSTPYGRMVYAFLAGVAEFERALIRERSAAGMARARAEGKRFGRPRAIHNPAEIWKLRTHHRMTFRAIARQLRLGYGTVVRAYNQQKKEHTDK